MLTGPFSEEYAQQIAKSLPITRGSAEAAIERCEANGKSKHANDIGGKEFWDRVKELIIASR